MWHNEGFKVGYLRSVLLGFETRVCCLRRDLDSSNGYLRARFIKSVMFTTFVVRDQSEFPVSYLITHHSASLDFSTILTDNKQLMILALTNQRVSIKNKV